MCDSNQLARRGNWMRCCFVSREGRLNATATILPSGKHSTERARHRTALYCTATLHAHIEGVGFALQPPSPKREIHCFQPPMMRTVRLYSCREPDAAPVSKEMRPPRFVFTIQPAASILSNAMDAILPCWALGLFNASCLRAEAFASVRFCANQSHPLPRRFDSRTNTRRFLACR